jgi:hypothetical protein
MEHYASLRHPRAHVRVVNLGRLGVDSAGLRDLFESTVGMRPDLAVVLCGHNEFLRPEPGVRYVRGILSNLATVRVASKLIERRWPGVRTAEILPKHVVGLDRAGAFFHEKERVYFDNMTAIARTARAQGVPLLLGTLPSNLRDWPPVFRRLERAADDPADVAAMETALAAANSGDASALRSFVVGPAARRPDDPMFRFLRGRLRLLEGDAAGALDDLVFARDLDPLPWRVTSTFNDFVRTLARGERTLFADLDEELRVDGVPGFDLLADNCHPTAEGARRMALAMLRAAERAGVLDRPDSDDGDVTEFLVSAGFVPGSTLRLRYLLENGKYMMKTPDFNFRLAHGVFEQAAQEFPGSWEVQANLGTVLLLAGDRREGMDALRRARAIHGGELDVSDRDALPYLYEALQGGAATNR